MKRLAVALLVAVIVASLSAPFAAAASAPSAGTGSVLDARGAPKVALIVGPVGGTTSRYRAMAREAAQVARQFTPNVVEVYSPDATWPAVAAALDGASVVVYLGHGNGWPSRYRDALYPATQNGFGLNPVAGADDSAHQYFGEASLDAVRLAPNAVVLLHHLCYASGNTEPGLAEGTLDQAVQRVDNYAAGFIRAGARAVVAEGHFEPAWYLRQLLTSNRSIESIWRAAPSRKGNEQSFASVRSPGYTARLDPDRRSSGFYRSLVTEGALDATAVRGGGTGLGASTIPVTPSLTGLGLRFGTLRFSGLPVAGVDAQLSLPFAGVTVADLPADVRVGVRWEPIEVATDPVAAPDGEGTAAPDGEGTAAPEGDADAEETAGSGEAAGPPELALVVPERPGTVVEASAAKLTKTRLAIRVAFPAAPGLYRLVPTLHLADGSAYDAATQHLLTPVLVRVGGPRSAAYGIATDVTVEVAAAFRLDVRVANTGRDGWATSLATDPRASTDEVDRQAARRLPARLVGTWVSTDGATVPAAVSAILPEAAASPGGQAIVGLALVAPAQPGSYLLVVDVASPVVGPLSAAGSAPALVRVTVTEPLPDAPAPPVLEGGA